ncbi:hypothetical protein BSLG_000236 [Batrachochytrium salamandrivorans]|nr:hypothetical protein BSLG_000236 [Batrachochytrium salamandrivorans]
MAKRSGGGSPSDSIAKPSPPALSITPLQSSNSSSGVLNRLPMQAGTTQSGWVKSPHSASPAYQHNTSLSDDSITTLYSPGYAYGSYPSDISYSNPVTVDIQKQQQEQHTLYPHKSNPHLTVSTHISGRQGDKETLHATATNTPTTSIYSPTSSYAADTSLFRRPRCEQEVREQSQLKQQQLQQLQHYLKLSKSPQQPPILYTESTLPQSATVSARQSTLSMDTLSGSSFSSEGGNTSTGGLIRPGYDARPVVRRMASMVHSRSALTNSGVHVILPERPHMTGGRPIQRPLVAGLSLQKSDLSMARQRIHGLLDELELVDFKDVDMGDQPLQQEISHSETSKAISDETNRLHRVKSEGKNNQPMRKNSEPQQVLEDVANGGKIISTSGEKDRPVSIAREICHQSRIQGCCPSF